MVKIQEDADFVKIEEVWLDNMKWCFVEDVSERIELPLDLSNIDE